MRINEYDRSVGSHSHTGHPPTTHGVQPLRSDGYSRPYGNRRAALLSGRAVIVVFERSQADTPAGPCRFDSQGNGVLERVEAALAANKGFQLVLAGHSLGAGT